SDPIIRALHGVLDGAAVSRFRIGGTAEVLGDPPSELVVGDGLADLDGDEAALLGRPLEQERLAGRRPAQLREAQLRPVWALERRAEHRVGMAAPGARQLLEQRALLLVQVVEQPERDRREEAALLQPADEGARLLGRA